LRILPSIDIIRPLQQGKNMPVWAIADLHLSFGVPNKGMEVFGQQWADHHQKIADNWRSRINADDLVLIPGDISWAMRPEEAKADLDWIHQLPGTKVILRGNHDYWWSSLKKVEEVTPPSIHLIQNNSFKWKNIAIGGTRLWDSPDFSFNSYVEYVENPRAKKLLEPETPPEETQKVFQRELGRLELSLKSLDKQSPIRIAMTHYPPISADLKNSPAGAILEKYGINYCVFGHLHNIRPKTPMFGTKNGVKYILTSCDYLEFNPIKVCD
jgi:uncharacterized protein